MSKLLFLDLETTGLYPDKHGIWQIAGAIVIDDVLEKEFDFKMAPFGFDVCDPKALDLNNLTEEQVRSFPEPRGEFRRFQHLLSSYVDPYSKHDKFFLLGFNVQFDERHLRAWFKKNKDRYFGSYFFWPSIDVAILAADDNLTERHFMPNFKLHTVAEHYGIKIEEEKLHDASYDIYLTRLIYEKAHGFRRPDLEEDG